MKINKKFFCIILYLVSTSAFASIKQEALESHNTLRAKHYAPPLVWDAKLASYAQNYASKCRFQHSRGSFGENLAAGYPSVSAAIHAWYDERKGYSYANPGFSYQTGHFTQLVWKSSHKLGCGYVACNGKNGTPGNYLVCEYSPAGNIINSVYFKKNVT
jgi:uncharacterized protein YkwD